MALPSGYKRLEYIQSSGTQYIDTLFQPNYQTKIVIDSEIVSHSSNGAYFGARSENTADNPFSNSLLILSSAGIRSDFYGSSVSLTSYPSGRHIVNRNKNVTAVGGSTITNTASTNSSGMNLYLFGINTDGSMTLPGFLKLYSCKIYDNDVLIRDFIPCQKPDGTIGLWDDVNSVFYGNAGTGTFTAGPVVAIAADLSEVTELEYIQSSGTQYINTAVSVGPNNASALKSVIDKMILTTNAYSLDGTGYGASPYNNSFYLGTDANRNIAYGDGRVDKTTTTPYDGSRRVFTYDAPAGLITVSDLLSINFAFSNPDTSLNFFLFAYNQGTYGIKYYSGNIYSAKIFQNGTLIRDYIAAKLADGTVGLYDKLHGLLYINVGTGTFTAGPVKEPPPAPATLQHLLAVRLAWSAVDGATGYNVYRDGVLLTSTTDTTFIDLTAEENTEYTYAVSAIGSGGESAKTTLTVYTKSGYFLYKPYVESANFP